MTNRALPPALALVGALSTSMACRGQSLGARSRFVEDGVNMAALADWDGERIKIDTEGVSPSGGLALSAGDTSRVSSVARMLAVADTFDKPNADRAILAATKSYTIATSAGVTTVTCGHGETFASAAGTDSGCDALDVSVPLGTSSKRISVDARSGNGKVVVSMDRAEVAELTLTASHGIIDVTTAITQA